MVFCKDNQIKSYKNQIEVLGVYFAGSLWKLHLRSQRKKLVGKHCSAFQKAILSLEF